VSKEHGGTVAAPVVDDERVGCGVEAMRCRGRNHGAGC
jgi:hypothetical protein